MKFCLSSPPLNPRNLKAQALPIFNPFDRHGRVFFFSWLSFMLSFMAWYAFPPLLGRSIRADLGLTRNEVLNSNIVALAAGFAMRFAVGPLCDFFGPRYVMAGLLFASAIPCGLAGTITSAGGLYAIRFFLGIAGATFVPCQVWCTGFYDKNVVGTANAFAAGWGNAGAGVTYFVMPAVYDSLMGDRGLSSSVSWRVSFIVPTILLIACGLGALLTTDDCPTGKWHERHEALAKLNEENMSSEEKEAHQNDKRKAQAQSSVTEVKDNSVEIGPLTPERPRMEIVDKPSWSLVRKALCQPQTLMLAVPYFASFGGELAINSILSSYYLSHHPELGQTTAGAWAAMFGLWNVITRPSGGFIADLLYKRVGPARGTKTKQIWYGGLVAMQGVGCLILGLVDPRPLATMVGLVAFIAIFMDAANGAAFSLLPHVNPQLNGLMSGTVGATGNLGGLIFSVFFRYLSYPRGIMVIGIFSLVIGIGMTIVHPIPKSQRGAGGYMST